MKSIVIDADSLIYIIAYHHKDSEEVFVHAACESFLKDIIKSTEAEQVLGVFSDPKPSWRESVYKYAPYKGTRGEKPEWVKRWMPVIKEYYISLGGFYELSGGLEADDILGLPFEGIDITRCSPDKDILQIPGVHFDYKSRTFAIVDSLTAAKNKYMLMLCGDTVDNIKGLPGIGEKKALAILDQDTVVDLHSQVLSKYIAYFGTHYGPIIFDETYTTVNIAFEDQPDFVKSLLSADFTALFKPTLKIQLENLLT